jgi:N-acetylglucosamine-6-phosphate deacetylase
MLKEKYPFLSRVSLAPEIEGGYAFGEMAKELGLTVGLAHSDADYQDCERALKSGYTVMTHLYSGMKGVTRKNSFRIAGAVEAGLYFDDLFVEIIADGRHLPIELLQFIYKCKGADRICLITDAIRAGGMPNGSETRIGSLKNGLPVIVEDEVAKLLDRQSFAGSVATADRLYRTMSQAIGKDMVALSKMSSLTPARVMGWNDRGEIAKDKRADLIMLDENLNVQKVILKGEII